MSEERRDGAGDRAAREARLKAALKANMGRRKAQARERAGEERAVGERAVGERVAGKGAAEPGEGT